MGAIYKITNNINQKIYIGKTIRQPLTRWHEHIQYSRQKDRYISGKRRKELTKDFLLPMRKNLEENQRIFLKLYPNFKVKRSDAK